MKNFAFLTGLLLCLSACSSVQVANNEALKDQVFKTEIAFAKAMENRDLSAFSHYISPEAVFFSANKVTRGRDAVVMAWANLFKEKIAPFSWVPNQVEVLDSGKLAISTGPVMNPKGEVIATFTSIWRREDSGEWQIIFDKGNDVCVICAGK